MVFEARKDSLWHEMSGDVKVRRLLGVFFFLASGLHELIRDMRLAPHISMDCPHRLLCAGSVGVFPPLDGAQ